MSGHAIVAENIVKQYGKRRALDGLTVQIPANTVTAVLGPNGAGKSTLFRLISSMTAVDSGSLRIFGQEPSWKQNRGIAYLPDRARWYPEHTVDAAMKWGQGLLPGFDIDLAQSLAKAMDLDDAMCVSEMSRGQEARLMLVMCAAREVPLIVLDEPFSGIDMISREHIIRVLIDRLSAREQTVLISTHEIVEAESLFDYAVFLQNGQTVLSGDVDTLRAQRGSISQIYRQVYH